MNKSNDIKNIKKIAIFGLLLYLSTLTGVAQIVLKGTVSDNLQDFSLPGAVVTLKSESTVGTSTDLDGNFSLKINKPLPVTLVVSYLGYKSKDVTVKDATQPLRISLEEDSHVLEDVVVTALGITKDKKTLGYTTQQLSSEQLGKGEETNIVNSLAGKVAGVRVTNSQGDMGSSRIVIRGETSIGRDNQPLFVLDGVPVDNSQLNSGGATRDFRNAIADLNPQDIESMSVLKGPNAAALYGSRAAHGVVIITTKSGRGAKGYGVTFNSGFTFSTVATLPTFQNVFGQGTNGLFSYVDGNGGGVNDGVDESWGPEMNGQLIPQFNSNGIATPFVAHPNNVKDFFRTGTTFNNGLSIAGSDEKFDYRFGVNYQDQKGTVPNTQIKKTNFTLNTDYKISKNIKIGATANYIITDIPNLPGGPSGNRAAGVMLQFLWFGRQVDTQALKADRSRNWNSSYYSNPYWNAYYNTVEQKRNRLIGDVHAEVHILDGLDFKFRTGTDHYNDKRKYKIKYGTSGTPYGSYAEDTYTIDENNTDFILTYKRDLTSDLSFDVLGGVNIRNRTEENNYQKAPRLAIPDLYTLANSRDAAVTSTSYYAKLRTYGLYGSTQFGFRNYAFLNLTARNDWSSTLPRTGRSYFYPSVNTSLLLTEMLGIQSTTLNYLKLRAGWSKVGHDADPYSLVTIYNSEAAFEGNPIQTSSKVKNNPNLKPELTYSTELGFETYLFNNRVHLDFAYYNTDSKNQILKLQTSAASGYDYQILNAGKINNKGFELQLGGTPLQLKDFEWNVNLNYSQNRSKVKELDKEGLIKSYTIATSGTTQVLATVGERYGTLFGSTYLRNDNGDIVIGDNGLPQIDPTSKVLGHYTPDWVGGISNTFKYKNFSLSVLIDASVGGKIYSGTNRTGTYTGVLETTLAGRNAEHGGLPYYYANNDGGSAGILSSTAPNGERVYQDGIIADGVKADGSRNTTVVSAEDYYKSLYNISEAFTYSASYVKLREVQFTYMVNKNFVKKLGIQGANVSIVARNLAFLYKKADNIDPEVALSTGNGQGIESLSLPTTRTFGFDISIQF